MIYLSFNHPGLVWFENLEGNFLPCGQIDAPDNFAKHTFPHEVQDKVATCAAAQYFTRLYHYWRLVFICDRLQNERFKMSFFS